MIVLGIVITLVIGELLDLTIKIKFNKDKNPPE